MHTHRVYCYYIIYQYIFKYIFYTTINFINKNKKIKRVKKGQKKSKKNPKKFIFSSKKNSAILSYISTIKSTIKKTYKIRN